MLSTQLSSPAITIEELADQTPLTETQATIEAWATATFGPPSKTTIAQVLARSNEETAELIRKAVSGGTVDEIVEEAADVAIVLSRAAVMTGEDITPLMTMRETVPADPVLLAMMANESLSFLLRKVAAGEFRADPSTGIYVNIIVTRLAQLCAALGRCLADEVTDKMVINRVRKWSLDGTGRAYHVDEGRAA